MNKSTEVVIEFVKGRPVLELDLRRLCDDGFKAPEIIPSLVREEILGALRTVTAEERTQLDRMRGQGDVSWDDVAVAFGWPETRG